MANFNRVLLVDDDRTSALVCTECLLDNGFEVSYAENAEKAKLILLTETFDFAVLDLMLPPTFGVEGLELYKYIKGRGVATSVVFITARDNGTIEIVAEAMKLGATDFLDKQNPLFLDKLVFALKELKILRSNVTESQKSIHEENQSNLDPQFADKNQKVLLPDPILKNVNADEHVNAIKSLGLVPDELTSDYVFISYSRADWNVFVEPLVKKLQLTGVHVWVDQHLIEWGEDWLDEINRALAICSRLVLCVSPNSLASRHVRLEYRFFFNHGKKIYPLICKDVDLPAELESIQYYNYDQQEQLINLLLRI